LDKKTERFVVSDHLCAAQKYNKIILRGTKGILERSTKVKANA
jgi:hypothetical protein